jgi:hypothetical protein
MKKVIKYILHKFVTCQIVRPLPPPLWYYVLNGKTPPPPILTRCFWMTHNFLLKWTLLEQKVRNYCQTWTNDHLWITTTCLQRPLFLGPDFNVYSIDLPLNNDHLSTTATILGSRGWSLYTGLTVLLKKTFESEIWNVFTARVGVFTLIEQTYLELFFENNFE